MKIMLFASWFFFISSSFLIADDRLIVGYVVNLSSFPSATDNVDIPKLRAIGKSFDNQQPARVTRLVIPPGVTKYAYLYVSTNTDAHGKFLDSLESKGYIYKSFVIDIKEYIDTTGRFTKSANTITIKEPPKDFYTFDDFGVKKIYTP